MNKIFDTHAHYDDPVYDVDREALFERMFREGVDSIALIGASYDESKSELELAREYNKKERVPKFYYTIGDHPDEILKNEPDSSEGSEHLDKLFKLYSENPNDAVAIGEIGLDYHGDFKTEEDYVNQKKWFIAEINLAKKLNLPIVVHSRDACKDTFDIIKENAKGMKGIIHCFSYEKEIAMEYVKLGFHIGIGGIITFKNARKTKEVVDTIPLEYIVTETDAPWLAPVPYRSKRNESIYIKYVIEEIANIKNVDIEDLSKLLYNNALNVYNIESNN